MLEELERVRAYRSEEPAPSDATVAAALAELLVAMRAEPGHAPARGATLRHAKRRRRVLLAAGIATAGLAVAGFLGFDTGSPATPQSALAAAMDTLATVAASQDWTGIPGPGQYLYTESSGPSEIDTITHGKECVISDVEHSQSWIATDGSGAINQSVGDLQFTSAADEALCASIGVTDPASQANPWSNRFPAGGLTGPASNWKGLSTDPATLLKQVHERDGGPNTPAELFVNVGDFLRDSTAPPAIRAALYRAAALIPGIELLGQQTDPAGQTGLAITFPTYPGGGPRMELIVSQQTGRLLTEEYYDKTTGKLVDWTAYTEQKIVDTLPDYPMSPPSAQGPGSTLPQATTSTPTSSAASN